MSWDKNTVVISELDAVKRVLDKLSIPYELDLLGEVRGRGLNDDYEDGTGTYPIRRFAYADVVVLEQLVRHPDCDADDYLVSHEFPLSEEPKVWDLVEELEYEDQ